MAKNASRNPPATRFRTRHPRIRHSLGFFFAGFGFAGACRPPPIGVTASSTRLFPSRNLIHRPSLLVAEAPQHRAPLRLILRSLNALGRTAVDHANNAAVAAVFTTIMRSGFAVAQKTVHTSVTDL